MWAFLRLGYYRTTARLIARRGLSWRVEAVGQNGPLCVLPNYLWIEREPVAPWEWRVGRVRHSEQSSMLAMGYAEADRDTQQDSRPITR